MKIRYTKAPPPLDEAKGLEGLDLGDLFSQLYLRSDGDVDQALEMLRLLAERFGLTGRGRTFEDLLDELEEKGLIRRDRGHFQVTPAGERKIRDSVFDRIYSSLGKGFKGNHGSREKGLGGERQPETRAFRHGDSLNDLDVAGTIRNSLKRAEPEADGRLSIEEEDLEVFESEAQVNCATVLMLDISHSMVLYGEDRITPAKTVAIGLLEFIRRRYPRDEIEVLTFGDEAKHIPADEIVHVSVGPFHTNTCDGLRLAQTLLRKSRNANKQIFMVTDGKPSAVFDRGRLYRNSFGLDPLVLQKTYAEARNCRKQGIRISTFMIAQDPYLIEFVETFSRICEGKAFYTGLDRLGESVFVDYAKNRRRRLN